MKNYYRALKALLKKGGCYFERQARGDHEFWYSPHSGRHVSVPTIIKSRHTANKILKDAGLEKAF